MIGLILMMIHGIQTNKPQRKYLLYACYYGNLIGIHGMESKKVIAKNTLYSLYIHNVTYS
jgi:hypothetical protein